MNSKSDRYTFIKRYSDGKGRTRGRSFNLRWEVYIETKLVWHATQKT